MRRNKRREDKGREAGGQRGMVKNEEASVSGERQSGEAWERGETRER